MLRRIYIKQLLSIERMTHHCNPCNKEFESKEAFEMHNLAKHIPAEQHASIRKKKEQGKQIKNIAVIAGITVIFLFLIYYIWTGVQGGTYSKGQEHWHAGIEIYVCGERVELPNPIEGSIAHGEPYIGTPLMHEHNDNTIHIEGTIQDASDITIGKFMDSIELTFTNYQLIDYKNGDVCPDGHEGQVKLLVNGEESNEFENRVIADDDQYVLLFE